MRFTYVNNWKLHLSSAGDLWKWVKPQWKQAAHWNALVSSVTAGDWGLQGQYCGRAKRERTASYHKHTACSHLMEFSPEQTSVSQYTFHYWDCSSITEFHHEAWFSSPEACLWHKMFAFQPVTPSLPVTSQSLTVTSSLWHQACLWHHRAHPQHGVCLSLLDVWIWHPKFACDVTRW